MGGLLSDCGQMSPNQTFSMEKIEKPLSNSPFMPLALPQYCDWGTSVRQRHLSDSDICPTAELCLGPMAASSCPTPTTFAITPGPALALFAETT